MGVGKASRQVKPAVDRCSCYVLECNLYRCASFAIRALRMLVGLIGHTVAGVAIPFIRHDPFSSSQQLSRWPCTSLREWTDCDKKLPRGSASGFGAACDRRHISRHVVLSAAGEFLQMEYLLYWLFFEFIGCSIARVVLPALSFGRVCVHSPNSSPERFNWFGYRHDGVGRLVVARDVTGFIGFIIMIVVCLAIVLMARPLWP